MKVNIICLILSLLMCSGSAYANTQTPTDNDDTTANTLGLTTTEKIADADNTNNEALSTVSFNPIEMTNETVTSEAPSTVSDISSDPMETTENTVTSEATFTAGIEISSASVTTQDEATGSTEGSPTGLTEGSSAGPTEGATAGPTDGEPIGPTKGAPAATNGEPSPTKEDEGEHKSSGHSKSLALGITIPLLIVLVAGVGFVLYRKRKNLPGRSRGYETLDETGLQYSSTYDLDL